MPLHIQNTGVYEYWLSDFFRPKEKAWDFNTDVEEKHVSITTIPVFPLPPNTQNTQV